MNLSEEILDVLKSGLDEFGAELSVDAKQLADYIAERAEFLARHTDDADFWEIAKQERENVATKAAIAAVGAGAEADAYLRGLLQSGLAFAAKMLRLIVV